MLVLLVPLAGLIASSDYFINKYNFIYNTTIRTNGFHFDCSEQKDLTPEERTKPFNEWEINNYQLVQDTASKAINACINRLKSEQNMTNFENALK